MSKQKGIIKLKGSMGGITFYNSNGEDLAKTTNGPDKEKINSDPAFQRTRENNKEFGGSSTASKALRTTLASVLQTVADSKLTSRLTKIFKEINVKGVGVRGQRPVAISANKTMLMNIDINQKTPFSSVFSAPYNITSSVPRNGASIEIPNFDPKVYITPPAGATHFRIIIAIGALSDFVYNASTGKYEPTKPALNTLNSSGYSPYEAVNSAIPVSVEASLNIPGSPSMPADVSLIVCLGIEFYQQVGSSYYLLAQGNALKLVSVF